MSNRRNHSIKALLDRHRVTVVDLQGLLLVVTQDLMEEAQALMAMETQDLLVVEEGLTMEEQGLTVVAGVKDLEV